MSEAMTLHKHGTKLVRLKPNNIIQAARADLRLKHRKEEKVADPDEQYAFAQKHVKRAHSVGHLIALAYFDPGAAATTSKKQTCVVYDDPALLKQALLITLADEAAA